MAAQAEATATTPGAAGPPYDARLVARLRRRGERPGVTDPGLARGIIGRHLGLTPGAPLAERLLRRAALAEAAAGPAVPSVLAVPLAPPALGDGTDRPVTVSPVAERPVARPLARVAPATGVPTAAPGPAGHPGAPGAPGA